MLHSFNFTYTFVTDPGYTRPMRGCLAKLLLWSVVGVVCVWAFIVVLNPWALHIGGRSTPFLYWHGSGIVVSKDGKSYPLYVSFWPSRPQGIHGGGHREGKRVSANLRGRGYLCLSPGNIKRMDMSGTMYGGYISSDDSLFDFRLLEWRKPYAINYQNRGFFDLAGTWQGQNLVMNRPNEQGIRLNTGPFIDNAKATLHWSTYSEFEASCRTTSAAVAH